MTLITSQLAIGDQYDPKECFADVDAFLCCAAELTLLRGKPGFHLPLIDGQPVDVDGLRAAYVFLDKETSEHHLILIYCQQGLCRSVAVLTGYLVWKGLDSAAKILERIQKSRSSVCPEGPVLDSILQAVQTLH